MTTFMTKMILILGFLLCIHLILFSHSADINCTKIIIDDYQYYTCYINSESMDSVQKLFEQRTEDDVPGLSIIVQPGLSLELNLTSIGNRSVLYLSLGISSDQNTSVKLTASGKIPNVRTLSIISYEITDDAFFSYFPRLETLFLQDCTLPSLPSFSPLRRLTYLSLRSPSFSRARGVQLEYHFKGLYLLSYLELNNFSATVNLSDSVFRDLISLSHLSLTNNLIQSISQSQFRGLYQLQDIILADNSITYLPYQAFHQLPNLRLGCIDVSGNPFNCSCQLQWMSIAAHKFNFKLINNPNCANTDKNIANPSNYANCPPITVSLQCLNLSRPLCPSPLQCYDTRNSSQCSTCPPGQAQIAEAKCIDVDSCSRDHNPCGESPCVNTPDSYICIPPSNPCSHRNGGCEQKCQSNVSAHWCECFYGYKPLNLNSSVCYYVGTNSVSYGNTPAVVFCVLFAFILVVAVTVGVVIWLRRWYRGRRLFAYKVTSEDNDPNLLEMQGLHVEQVAQSEFALPQIDPVQ